MTKTLNDANPGNVNSYKESRSIGEVLASITAYIDSHGSNYQIFLNNPATQEEITALENIIGVVLPEDIKKLYLIANGQDDLQRNCLPLLGEGYHFMSLSSISSRWLMLKEQYEEEVGFGELFNIQGAVYGYNWTPHWIPIGHFASGDLIFIDYKPTPAGKVGQIVEYISDNAQRDHLGFTLTDHLGNIDCGLKSGKLSINEKYGIITKNTA